MAGNFVNKLAVAILPLPMTILFIQLLTAALALRLLAVSGAVRLAPLSLPRLQQLLPISLCYLGHALLVLYSLARLNIPMYNTLKRLTPVIVLAFKVRGCERGRGGEGGARGCSVGRQEHQGGRPGQHLQARVEALLLWFVRHGCWHGTSGGGLHAAALKPGLTPPPPPAAFPLDPGRCRATARTCT